MKNIKYIIILFLLLGLSSCSISGGKTEDVGKKDANFDEIIKQGKIEHLAKIYLEHGNFINTKQFPPIIKAKDVFKNINKWLIIDIRSKEAYESGHINGAYNVPQSKVLDFLKNDQKALAYPKVIFVCYSGQIASYVTGITRYAGFNNTFVLKFGMASWNSKFSDVIKNGFGTRYADMLVKATNKSATIPTHHNEQIGHKELDLSNLPKLPIKVPTLLMAERAQTLLSQDRKSFLLKADEFFPVYKEDISKIQPVFYINKIKYYAAHIKGAELFEPRKDLSLDARLTDLPIDKNILIHCKTGHSGGNTTAYLNMLGYKAQNLMFGINGFMYDLWKQKGWMSDINKLSGNFPVITGAKRTSAKIIATTAKKATKTAKPIVKPKKKEAAGGC